MKASAPLPGICAPLRENLWWCVVVVVRTPTSNHLRQASQNLGKYGARVRVRLRARVRVRVRVRSTTTKRNLQNEIPVSLQISAAGGGLAEISMDRSQKVGAEFYRCGISSRIL